MKQPPKSASRNKQPYRAVRKPDAPSQEQDVPFPIVGIGASAGGLEALAQFLSHVRENSGMAFVIVQHQDPTHEGIMPELLRHSTGMPVLPVKDRMKVKPDSVYVIPPNKDMSLLRGALHLFEPVAPRGLHLPIDFFFRSLANDRGEWSIGVILSGMGSDGAAGLKAIKEKAGLTLAQDPASAKFDSMPRSAINAGLADFVAPADQLPEKIAAYFKHAHLVLPAEAMATGREHSALDKITALLRAHTGHDFSLYKKSCMYRRIERRIGLHQIGGIADYVRYLQKNPAELEILFKELLIGVTGFFRDSEAWEKLKQEAIPALLSTAPAGATLRAWTPGCSTGEEAYSLAMVFKEALDQVQPRNRFSLQIFATDLDRDAIGRARRGLFPANIATDVSPERLSRFFVEEDSGYRISADIREKVIFAPQNLIMDPPFTKLDILVCRNLLIYLEPGLQKKLLPLFHYSLKPGGILFLGSAEAIGGAEHLFAPLNGKNRLFRRIEPALHAEPIDFPSSFAPPPLGAPKDIKALKPAMNLQSLAEQILLRHYSPPAVLVNEEGDILYINGRTGKYLEPAAGKANWNLFAMAREELRYELLSAFRKALRQGGKTMVEKVGLGAGGKVQAVDVTIHVIQEPAALQGLAMIVFRDVEPHPGEKTAGRSRPTGARTKELEQELGRARADLQTSREEMQTSQEELKALNEELQSANEELQSTNEELTTSKEELQSLNEELQTVNAEQSARLEELARANNDMMNLLNSTDIATVFLDNALHVRRFTTQATKIIRLIASDVGRPLSDIVTDLRYAGLDGDAREVLRTLAFSEKQISTGDGRWFSVRIMPYRTLENVIDGVVITFSDITAAKTLEAELRRCAASSPDSHD